MIQQLLTRYRKPLLTALLTIGGMAALQAQDVRDAKIDDDLAPADSVVADRLYGDSISRDIAVDSLSQDINIALGQQPIPKKEAKDWSAWRPNPQKALWLAIVFPGGGQIYNRKYWKLPIVYGGFIGCLYAMNWNNNMYKDYSQAFIDISDSNPNTDSYNKFLHLGATITSKNMDTYRDIFKKRKDRYRRWRDLSFFVLIGVYALSVIDAYVDAELSVFDISKDLSLKVEPTIINDEHSRNPLDSRVGLQCSLNF